MSKFQAEPELDFLGLTALPYPRFTPGVVRERDGSPAAFTCRAQLHTCGTLAPPFSPPANHSPQTPLGSNQNMCSIQRLVPKQGAGVIFNESRKGDCLKFQQRHSCEI